ncbi:MAG: adenosylmethionine decarboxylase [Pseudomonadota bacterium]|nr:adenosylmethionine decarboxylase [Pseudomonadota bacterium]
MTHVVGATFSPAGVHVIADLAQIDPCLLSDAEALAQILHDAAHAAGATVLSRHFHHFGSGAGVTGVVLLAESHMSLHTWPEAGFAALDIFMCGQANADRALAQIVIALGAQQQRLHRIVRGGSSAPVTPLQTSSTQVES